MTTLKEAIEQANDDLRTLQTRFNKLKLDGGYDKDDQRYFFLESCETVLLFTRIHLDFFLIEMFGANPPRKQRLPKTSSADFKIHRTNNDKFNKICLLTTLMFQVEGLFKSISKELPGTPQSWGFKHTVDHVLSQLALSGWQDKSKMVNGPAKIRNVLHAAGRFNENNDFVVNYGTDSFTFESGEVIRFVYWNNVSIFLNGMTDVIEEVLNSPQVRAINHINEI